MVRPMVHSEKHIHPRSLLLVPENTGTNLLIAHAVAAPSGSNQVREGCTIKAVYIEMWYVGESSQPPTQISSVEKVIGGATLMTFAQSVVLNDYPNKKNLFQISQGVIGDSNTNPVPVFRGWIPIPKSKQRMGLDDKIVINFSCVSTADNGMNICGTFIYKEYF